MSFERKSKGNTASRVLADSANAKHRFGFAGNRSTELGGNAPKLSDLWFLEFTTVTDQGKNNLQDVSVLAKTVSPISIQTSTMPIDQYGKRIYVPTRVDFPEVSLTMYDDISGKMFDFVSDIYSKFFSNNDATVSGANAEEVLTGVGDHGRKFPGEQHEYFHQNFEKVTVYHFFGNLDSPMLGSPPSSLPRNAGHGTIQKIELINPLVTGITFSGSDYSTTELRTVDMSLQPENVIIGKPTDVAFPDWMTLGMDYMLETLTPLYSAKNFNAYPEANKDKFFNITPKTEEELKKQEALKEHQDDKDTKRKLNELMKLYNAQITNPNEQGNEALEGYLKERIDVLDAARANKWTKEPMKTFVDDFNTRDESTFTNTYLNPDVPTFGGIGESNPPTNSYPNYTTDLGDAMVQELVSSFFGQRSFNANNVFNLKQQLQGVANSIQSSLTSNLTIDGTNVLNSAITANNGAFETTEKAFKPFVNENADVIHTGQLTGVSKIVRTRKK